MRGIGRGIVLRASGTVAVLAGTHQLLTGMAGTRGAARLPADRNLDSELRFYSAWYVLAGVLMHRAAARPELDRQVGTALAGGWALAGSGRLLSLRAAGRPDPLFLALLAAEFAVAAALAPRRRSQSPASRD